MRSSQFLKEHHSFFIFLFSSILSKSISFLLLPFFTSHLSPSNYGEINMLNNYTIVLTPFIFLSVLQTVSSDFFKLKKDSFNDLASSLLLLPIANTIIFLLLFLLFYEKLATYFHTSKYLFFIAPILVLGNFFTELNLILLRNLNLTWKYFWYVTIKISLELVLSVVLILFIFHNEWGRIIGIIFGSIISIPLTYYFFKNKFNFSLVKWALIKNEFLFSVPLIINQFAFSFFLTSDKLFVAKISSISELGNYSVAYQISFLLIIVSNSFYTFFAPKLFKALADKSTADLNTTKRNFYRFVVLMIVVSIATFFIGNFIYDNFVGTKFHSGKKYLWPIISSLFFWSITSPLYSIFYYFKSKLLITATSLSFIIINAIMNFFASKYFGVMGVACSMIIFYFLFFVVVAILYFKILKGFIISNSQEISLT